MPENEKDLIACAKSGDVSAFETLVESHKKRIFNLCFKMLGNIDDASDLSQEVFVKIFLNLKKFKGGSAFSTWLHRVTVNTCLDYIKKNKKYAGNISIDERIDGDGAPLPELADEGEAPSEAAEKKELKEFVASALQELSEQHRIVIILRDIEGFSYAEISEILKCSEGTVKSRVSRGRERLKEILTQNKELIKDFIV